MRKQLRHFILFKPILNEMGGVRLPATIPTYGIFHYRKAEGRGEVLDKIVSYDLDQKEVSIPFSFVVASSHRLPFKTLEEIQSEIDRLRQIEFYLPRLTGETESLYENAAMREAILMTQFRSLAQFRIVMKKFLEG